MSVEGLSGLEVERQGKVENKVLRGRELAQTKIVEVDQRHEGPVQVVER